MSRSTAPDRAGRLGLFALGRADDRRVDHIALRVGHVVRQVGRLHLVQPVIPGVRHFRADGLGAFAAGGAVLIDEARGDFQRHAVVAAAAGYRDHFGHGHQADVAVLLDAAKIDFQPAGGMAHLRKVAVEPRRAAAEDWCLFDQDHLLAAFGGFEGGRHAADAAADDQDGLVGCY
jgi:hypothetical protein